MAIINASYFFGDLTIAQKSDSAVSSSLAWFIDELEPRLLTDLLGYLLYKDFTTGLQQPTVEQKWANLLYGAEYTDRAGIYKKYMGLTNSSSGILTSYYWPQDIEVVVGSGETNAPAAGTREYHNADLVGKSWRVVRKGAGQLSSQEITKVSDGFVMTASPTSWIDGEIFFIQFTAPAPYTVGMDAAEPVAKKSLIANYVYWHWMENEATNTTGTGEKVAANANAVNASPGQKMVRAWNQMVWWNWELIEFLLSNPTDYPQFTDHYGRIPMNLIKRQNLFNI